MVVAAVKKFKRTLEGVVVSDKGSKTITVEVVRKLKHAKYSKFIFRSKKYRAHDENSSAKVGDKVLIIESRPYSKTKRWELREILK